MGLFGISLPNPLHALKSAADWVGHEASDAGHFVADHAGDLKYLDPDYDLYRAGKWLFEKAKEHWKTLVTIAVGVLVFTAVVTVIVLSGGTATALLTIVAASALSGAASETTQDLLAGKTPGWDVLKSAAVSAAFAAVSFGVLRAAAPALEPLATRFPVVAKLGLVPVASDSTDAATAAARAAAKSAVAEAVAKGDPAATEAAEAAIEREAVPFKAAVTAALKKVRPSVTKVMTLFSNPPAHPNEKKPADPEETGTPASRGLVHALEKAGSGAATAAGM